MVTKVHDPAAYLVDSLGLFRDLLASHKAEIDRLNVFPVPDGDTGTNMTLTLNSVVSHLSEVNNQSLTEVTRALAMGSLLGARGNSGVILSQLLKGISEAFASLEGPLNPEVIAQGLMRGSRLADSAVLRPKEGTILTVARAGAESAARYLAQSGKFELGEMLTQVLREVRRALIETTNQLEQLKKADVVD
ncbi:MAG: DAK2 domain-containing protein, partial [Acidimicrobiaceae bacterium]|nr:DAK2 domain-containing protein [Acidimicrobiaceae bacterium]